MESGSEHDASGDGRRRRPRRRPQDGPPRARRGLRRRGLLPTPHGPSDKPPRLDVNVNVNARPQSETDFEIELKLEAKAARGEETLFIAEVSYAGLFQIRNVPQEQRVGWDRRKDQPR